MRMIHEYPFVICDRFSIKMPPGSVILTAFVQVSNGRPSPVERKACMWAEVDVFPEGWDTIDQHERHFAVIGTGHRIPETFNPLKWIATFPDPPFVWHLYEVT